jgi:hypothetical protein
MQQVQQVVQPVVPMLPPQAVAAQQMQMQQMQMQMMAQQTQQQPQQAVAPAAPPATGEVKKKGIKLKNAAMARPGGAVSKPADDSKDDDRPGDDNEAKGAGNLDLSPPNRMFDRVLMLRIWRACKSDPITVAQLKAQPRPGEKTPTGADLARGKTGVRGRDDHRPLVGQDYKPNKKKPEVGGGSLKDLGSTGKGYKITEASSRTEDIERKVKSLLNKICPENMKTIVERLAQVDLHKAEELQHVITIILNKALAEPHYCETYADMVFALRTRYPEFPPEHEGEKAHTFTRVLLNTCQTEFENLPTSFEPTDEERQKYSADELRLDISQRKAKMLANMKFIGNLFLRQLLAVKVIGQVVHDLIGIKDQHPEEHMIECVCELLQAIGYSLDNTQHGKMLVTQFSHRLLDLKKVVDPATGRQVFSKRIQFQIQDLIDLRNNNWHKKLFKEQAKTKDEVRKDAQKEARQSTAKNVSDVMFSTQVAGMRPSYIDEFKNPTQRRKVPEQSRAQFDQAHVKRCFQYYAEDRNASELHQEWQKPGPTKDQSKQGMEWLCEIGFQDASKEDIVAETIVQLVAQLKIVHWEILKEALGPMLDSLEDVTIDIPTAPKFVHSLYARFIHVCGRDFNTTLLKILPLRGNEGSDMVWSLLCGILKKLKSLGGLSSVRGAFDMKEFKDVSAKAKQCEASRLQEQFSKAGVQV